MIGITGKTGKICEHVSRIVEQKSRHEDDIISLQTGLSYSNKEIECSRDIINKLYQSVDDLQKNTVSNDDIDELITDIRTSFELFVNNTPRFDDEKFKQLEERFAALTEKFETWQALTENGEIEIIKKTTKSIPKLNISRKKI
jgi:hypothetical protein